jgi:hypothetical protein
MDTTLDNVLQREVEHDQAECSREEHNDWLAEPFAADEEREAQEESLQQERNYAAAPRELSGNVESGDVGVYEQSPVGPSDLLNYSMEGINQHLTVGSLRRNEEHV